jgi:amino acid permease
VLGDIGLAIFIYQRNGVIINLRASAKYQRKFPIILYIASSIIVVWFLVIGLTGYLAFRD